MLCRLTYVGRGLKCLRLFLADEVFLSPHIRGARIEIQDLYDDRDCDYDENASSLPGTSAICAEIICGVGDEDNIANIKERLSEAKGYAEYHHQTDVVLLITGDNEEYGVDPNEVVLGYQYGDNYDGAKILAKVEIA